MKTFAKAVVLITAFAVTTRAIGFIFRIFLSRILGPELLGVYQIAFSFFMVFLTIIASGLPIVISRKVAIGNFASNKKSLRKLIAAALVISLSTSFAIIILVFALASPLTALFADPRSMPILATLIPAIIAYSIYTVFRAVWWGQKRFFLLGVTELTEQIARVLIFLAFFALAFMFTDFAFMAALSFTIACFISAVIVVILYWRESKKSRGTSSMPHPVLAERHYNYLLKTATPITAVRVITSVILPVIAIIIPMRLIASGWASSDAVAHFGIAVGMTLPLLSIPQTVISSMATALVPELSNSYQSGETEKANRQIKECIKFTLFVNFLLIPVFMAVGVGLGRFLFNNEQAGIYLVQSAWIMIPLSLSLITNAILNSLGLETRAMAHYVIGSFFLLLAVWFLPQFIGVGALIVGIGICTSIASVLNLGMIARHTNADIGFGGMIFKFILISIPAILSGHFLFNLVDSGLPLILSLPIAGGVTFTLLLALAYVFNLVEFESFKSRFKLSGSRYQRSKT